VFAVCAVKAGTQEKASSAQLAARERSFVDERGIEEGWPIVRSSCSTSRNLDAEKWQRCVRKLHRYASQGGAVADERAQEEGERDGPERRGLLGQ
jgi:hypothetical protein